VTTAEEDAIERNRLPPGVTMNEEERALIEAIRQQPDDDAVRLVYADWLTDRGDPRGEFIQGQVRWQQAYEARDYPAMRQLGGQFWRLQHQHEEQWLAPLKKLGLSSIQFRRGLPESGTIKGSHFLKRWQKLFEAAPLLRDVGFYKEKADLLPALTACPGLRRLDTLSMMGCVLRADDLAAFAASPNAANLRELSLATSYRSPAPLAAACGRLIQLPQLTRLKLDTVPLGDAAVTALAQAPELSRVRLLSLRATGITDQGVNALVWSAHLACSEALYLDYNDVTDQAARFVAASPRSVCLTELGFDHTQVGNAGIEALTRSPHLNALHTLHVSTTVTARGAAVLAGAPFSTRLRELELSCNPGIGYLGGEALAASPHLAKLKYLNPSDCRVGRQGALALINSSCLSGLQVLQVGSEEGRYDRVVAEAMAKRFGE
jgi:uncharacterized protein (TIGR02996 family)